MPDNEDVNENEKEKKKKKKPTVKQLARYNAYVKKTMLRGETPAPRDKWIEIHGGEK